MNRYEQYVPVQLNYKPFIPNFDKWGEVLKEQQNKYDTFNQSFNLAVPEHIKQDTEEFKIWNNYLQNSKDEVKNAFIKDPQLGNQKLKNKMFELQKEMNSGLYKGLETRKAEYVAASNQLSEEIKDQPWYKQEYYMDQFKAKPMNYKDGEFSHINPVSTTKNAERNKKLMEYTKAIVPPHVAEQAIRFNQQGEYGAAGMWMVNESIVKDYMDPTEFRNKIQAYINANPDLQEDVQIEASIRDKHLAEESKVQILDNHINKIELGKVQLLEKKDKYNTTTNKREILDLQDLYNLPKTGEMTPELKEAIEQDYNKQLEILESAKNTDVKSLLYNQILDNEASALYPIVPNKQEHKIDFKTNDYYKLQLEQDFNARQKELDRRAAAARSAARTQAMQEMVAKQVMSGAVQDSESLSNPMTALGYKQAAEDAFQVTKTGLENNILNFIPGIAKMSPAAKSVEIEKSSRSLLGIINNIERTNIANKSEEEQRQILNQFDYFKGKSPAEALRMMRDFKESYLANREAKNKSDNMNSLINTNTEGYKELSGFVTNTYNKYGIYSSPDFGVVDENGKRLTLKDVNSRIINKQKVFVKTPSPFGVQQRDITDEFVNGVEDVINKHPELKTSNPLLGEMYIDKNKKGEYFQKLQSSTIPSLVTEFQGGRLKSILDDKQTAVFRSYSGDGKVEELTYKDLITKYKVDPKKMDVYPDLTGGNPGFSVYYTTEDGKSFTTKVGLSNSMKAEMKEIGINMMQTAKISGNTKAHAFWTQYTGAMDDIPFYSFSNNNVPGEPAQSVEGTPVQMVYSKQSPNGVTYGTINENGTFYLGMKSKDGRWIYARDQNNDYIHSNNVNDMNKSVYDQHIGNSGTAFKVQGPANSLLPFMNDEEDEE